MTRHLYSKLFPIRLSSHIKHSLIICQRQHWRLAEAWLLKRISCPSRCHLGVHTGLGWWILAIGTLKTGIFITLNSRIWHSAGWEQFLPTVGDVDQVQKKSSPSLVGFPDMGYPNSWMVYFTENPIKADDVGGTTILGNHQIQALALTQFLV